MAVFRESKRPGTESAEALATDLKNVVESIQQLQILSGFLSCPILIDCIFSGNFGLIFSISLLITSLMLISSLALASIKSAEFNSAMAFPSFYGTCRRIKSHLQPTMIMGISSGQYFLICLTHIVTLLNDYRS